MIARLLTRYRMFRALRRRKAVRVAEQERARMAYWKAERKRHARDPLMVGR